MAWISSSQECLIHAEKKLLNCLDSQKQLTFTVKDVKVGSGPEDYVHEISGGEGNPERLVVLTGYGGGVALYYPSFKTLAKRWHFSAVDWLGKGLSGRPAFTARNNAETVDFFVSALESWARASGLLPGREEGNTAEDDSSDPPPKPRPFTILAHSMGAYLALEFARRHPDHVRQLIMIAPAGLTSKPIHPDGVASPYSLAGLRFRAFRAVWNSGFTPGMLVRMLGPLGRVPLMKYCADRFRGVSPGEREALEDYLFHVSAGVRPSGEFALRHILQPMVWSPHNWEERLGEVRVPLTMIYSREDPLDYREGARMCIKLAAARGRLTEQDLRVFVVAGGGHFAWINCREDFEAALELAAAPRLAPEAAPSGSERGAEEEGSQKARPEKAGRCDAAAAGMAGPSSSSPAVESRGHGSSAGQRRAPDTTRRVQRTWARRQAGSRAPNQHATSDEPDAPGPSSQADAAARDGDRSRERRGESASPVSPPPAPAADNGRKRQREGVYVRAVRQAAEAHAQAGEDSGSGRGETADAPSVPSLDGAVVRYVGAAALGRGNPKRARGDSGEDVDMFFGHSMFNDL